MLVTSIMWLKTSFAWYGTWLPRHRRTVINFPIGNHPALYAKSQIITSANHGVKTVYRKMLASVTGYSISAPRFHANRRPRKNPTPNDTTVEERNNTSVLGMVSLMMSMTGRG